MNLGGKQKQLLNGQVDSIEKYKETAGYLKGAFFVLNLADTVEAEVQAERAARQEIEAQKREIEESL